MSPSEGWRSRHAQRTSGEFLSRRDGTRTEYLEYILIPSSPDGSDIASDIQVEMERHAEMAWRRVLMENRVAMTYLLRADFEE